MFNLSHWQSLGAKNPEITGQAHAEPELGPGLEPLPGGGLKVTDPAGAWIQVPASTRGAKFIKVETSKTKDGNHHEGHVPGQVHVRLDARYSPSAGWTRGSNAMVVYRSARSHYLRNKAEPPQTGAGLTALRLWVEEPAETRLSIRTMTPDVRVPLNINPVRLIAMAALILLIAAFLPGSRLWRTPLNTKSRGQRLALTLTLAPLAVWAICSILNDLSTFVPGDFHNPDSYTYDFNQYDHVAQALLQGRPWLDLDQAPGLAAAENPYDIVTRNNLLAQDQKPIYWDYVYWEGHWYSYFGVLPAILLFMPYRALTSLFHPGGYALPTSAAASFLTLLATVAMVLAIIRLLDRHFPGISLASTILALVTVLTGSNIAYLWCRKSFYTVPFAAGLLFVMTGLWIWLGARRVHSVGGGTRMWTLADGGEWLHTPRAQEPGWTLSKPRVFLGSLCIAATLGCRPTFIVAGLLAIPIFSQEIRNMMRSLRPRPGISSAGDGVGPSPAVSATLLGTALLPLLIVAAPLLWYNHWRFGSALDFGNRYQMTVVDLTQYHPDLGSLPRLFGYYLFQPLSTKASFPFLRTSPAPLNVWHYTEPGIGGLLVTTPVILVCLILLCSAQVRRNLKVRNLYGLVLLAIPLALLVMVMDAYLGGFSDRYMIDFAWLLALAAVMVLSSCDRSGQNCLRKLSGTAEYPDRADGRTGKPISLLLTLSCLVSVLLMLGYVLVLLSHFETAVFSTIEVWFTCL